MKTDALIYQSDFYVDGLRVSRMEAVEVLHKRGKVKP